MCVGLACVRECATLHVRRAYTVPRTGVVRVLVCVVAGLDFCSAISGLVLTVVRLGVDLGTVGSCSFSRPGAGERGR